MPANAAVVLDACVLAPHSVCDLYLRLAEEPRLYSPRWTKEILAEVRRTQVRDLGYPERLADYWREQVTLAFPESLVKDYEAHIAQCANHPKDRHVLAAAIQAPAQTIVTFNLKDFPSAALAPHGVATRHPSDYLCTLYDEDPDTVGAAIIAIARGRKVEPVEHVRRLRKALPRFAAYFADRQGWTL